MDDALQMTKNTTTETSLINENVYILIICIDLLNTYYWYAQQNSFTLRNFDFLL